MADKLTDEEFEKERNRRMRSRSVAIAWIIVALVVLFYAATIVRLGGNVLNKPNLLKSPQVPTFPVEPKKKTTPEATKPVESKQ